MARSKRYRSNLTKPRLAVGEGKVYGSCSSIPRKRRLLTKWNPKVPQRQPDYVLETSSVGLTKHLFTIRSRCSNTLTNIQKKSLCCTSSATGQSSIFQ